MFWGGMVTILSWLDIGLIIEEGQIETSTDERRDTWEKVVPTNGQSTQRVMTRCERLAPLLESLSAGWGLSFSVLFVCSRHRVLRLLRYYSVGFCGFHCFVLLFILALYAFCMPQRFFVLSCLVLVLFLSLSCSCLVLLCFVLSSRACLWDMDFR